MSRWIVFCFFSLCSASVEVDEEGGSGLVTFGEIFASWAVLVMLVLLIVVLNYFERVRQPPVPMLEKYTKHLAVPPHVIAKFEDMTLKGKAAIYTWAIELPYVGKMIKGADDMKPLKHDTKIQKIPDNDDSGQKEDYRDMIIGAPLDEDGGMSSPGSRTSPKSPPLVVVKTMIDDEKQHK